MQTALIIIHVIIAVTLTAIVLMQQGKQQGLSGAIAGGAETFFGKNKGRTIDAMLKKFTAVLAILFIVSSVTLTVVTMKDYSAQNAVTDDAGSTSISTDEYGNLVDQEGNILMTAEEIQAQQAAAEAEQAAQGEEGAPDGTNVDPNAAALDGAEADAAVPEVDAGAPPVEGLED